MDKISGNSTNRKVCSRFYERKKNRGETIKSTTNAADRIGFSTSIGEDDENKRSGKNSSS